MKIFYCSFCKHRVFFENVQCSNCSSTLAFVPETIEMQAFSDGGAGDGSYVIKKDESAPSDEAPRYRMCQNRIEHANCFWAIPVSEEQSFCRACRLNVTIPNLSQPGTLDAWTRLERAKRWLFCNLLELQLPLPIALDPDDNGQLRFAFMASTQDQQVFTGQSDGLITINISEASDPFREKTREMLGETYRTLLGHFRHEIGHYYWDRLIKDSDNLGPFRELFGDETISYEEAKQKHYGQGAASEWTTQFVSAYASMHPWEDWAETWAHYLHMVDTLATARNHDIVVSDKTERGHSDTLKIKKVDFSDFDETLRLWLPFTIALNALNRSMGQPDAYPFVLSEPAVQKLRFVHRIVLAAANVPAKRSASARK